MAKKKTAEKNTKQHIENESLETEKRKISKFQWFLFVGVIPLMFAIVVFLVVSTFAGINVFEKGKEIGGKIPFLSAVFTGSDEKTMEQFEKEIVALEGEIKDREAQIEQLESELEKTEQELMNKELEVEQLEMQIEELHTIQEENRKEFKDIVKTYESMSAKRAAPIIAEMNEDDALKILSNLKSDTLAAILENLSPDKAARFTQLLTVD